MIDVQAIPHSQQRYDTCGDYWWIDGKLVVRISILPDERMMLAIAIHEIIEAFLCKLAGIAEPDIVAFDEAYELNRESGTTREPGDDPHAPYHIQHSFASAAERIYVAASGLNWQDYEDAVYSLNWPYES